MCHPCIEGAAALSDIFLIILNHPNCKNDRRKKVELYYM